MVTVYACQDGKNNQTALSRQSSVTYLARLAVEQWQTNVIPVMKDTFLPMDSVSLVTRPVKNVEDLVLINAALAGKANGLLILVPQHVNAAI